LGNLELLRALKEREKPMNIEATLNGLVALGATWVLWLLLALSVIAVAVMLERLTFFVRTRVDATALRAELNRGLASRQLAQVERLLQASHSLEARIVAAGIGASSAPEAEQRMAAEALLQRLRCEQHLAFLGTLGNNAPFVGLLGTVLGIIGAFHQLNQARGQITAGLMAQIGEALVATAVGLVVALPAVATYNAFQRAIQVRLHRGDALGRELMAHLLTLEPPNAAATPESGPQRVAGE
jgi:biopolymer transport protein ExbB